MHINQYRHQPTPHQSMKYFGILALVAATIAQVTLAANCPEGLKCSGNSKEEAFLVKKIQENACFVISKSYCPYCKRAKAALRDLGANCDIVELDQRQDGHDLQRVLADMTGRRTVPNVFIGGKNIGGSDDTVRLAEDGSLKRMLKAANAMEL